MKVLRLILLLTVVLSLSVGARAASLETLKADLQLTRGVVALVGLPEGGPEAAIELAKNSELTLYVQLSDATERQALQSAADKAGLLNQRVFVDSGTAGSIRLANDIADAVLVAPSAEKSADEKELLRVLRPQGIAYLGSRKLAKPIPEGYDDWSHPYHGPDNNPNSPDTHVHGTFRTQFIAAPKFSPMPEQTVIAGGRLYKAMGHIAHKANQNPMLNTLIGVNAYNGTILWKRTLPKGFMIHRNTMIAGDDALYLGDFDSCKVIDGATGKVRDEIKVPKGVGDGPVWKWMAIKDGTLFALVGNPEIKVDTQKSARRGLGHWPWGMWQGHDYGDPKTSFGFGRTLVAFDLKTKKLLWQHSEEEFLDARGLCMNKDTIFAYSPEKYILAVDPKTGEELWKNSDKNLLTAIGADGKAQHYVTGYATTCFMKCSDDYLFFSGPQREHLVVAAAANGSLVWSHEDGNLQIVLREDGIYAAGPKTTGVKLDYATGDTLANLSTRRACTRATGCIDSVFYRTSGGTVRLVTDTNNAQHIAPMRPPCQDGVLVSNGHLYWGPWMCGCQLSLYGNIALGPAHSQRLTEPEPALRVNGEIAELQSLASNENDWTTYRGDNARTDVASVSIPANVKLEWSVDVSGDSLPTAPVAAGGLVFVADRNGTVRALDASGKQVWKSYTAGPIYYAPTIAGDRLFVGSADGRVYAYEAATGRELWSYRVGPAVRRVTVYESLISTWPVSGGVVVQNGTVYAAAGIAHYDGTFVVALDAATGQVKAKNDTSGVLSEEANSGISLQGNLTILNGELQFLAGGVYETARYDLKTLKCLNTPRNEVTSQFRTAFYPLYPGYGKYVSLEYACGDGNTLCADAAYEGSSFGNLALQEKLPPDAKPIHKDKAGEFLRRRGRNANQPQNVWQDKANRRFTSFIVGDEKLLATGHPDLKEDQAFVAAVDVKTGADAWLQKLPANVVKGGSAIDRDGNIYVALENGQLLRFAATK